MEKTVQNNSNILITADSTCDLPEELIEKNDIKIIPLSILLGSSVYRDGIDVKSEDIYSFTEKTGELPKTSAVTPAEYYQVFKQAVDSGKSVVHIGLSSAISSSYQNALVAACNFENIYCIDSKSLCTAMGLLVLKACDFRNDGLSAKEITQKIKMLVPKVNATFVINNLEYLHKGGRCSGVAKFGANVLGIKPSIAVDNSTGKMDVAKKYRGKSEAVYKNYTRDTLASSQNIDFSRVVIANSGGVSDEILAAVADIVQNSGDFKEIIYANAGCTISSHCGPKTLAIFYIEK